MLSSSTGNLLDTYIDDYVVFDLETTGVSKTKDQIVEIGAIKVKDGKVVDELSMFVNPNIPIPPEASAVNNITDDMVKNAPKKKEAMETFVNFIGESVLVGHNISGFDMAFIWRDCEEVFGKIPNNDYIDTLRLARMVLPKNGSHKLTTLAEYYNIPIVDAHRATGDCRMTKAVFEKLSNGIEEAKKNAERCPSCGNILILKGGKFGKFWGCSNYPRCRYTKNV